MHPYTVNYSWILGFGFIVLGIIFIAFVFIDGHDAPWAIMIRKFITEQKLKIVSGAGLLAALVFIMTRKSDPENRSKRDLELKDKLAEARANAALEIGRAQGREEQIHEEVKKIITVEDKDAQLKQLADLVTRTRRRK